MHENEQHRPGLDALVSDAGRGGGGARAPPPPAGGGASPGFKVV